MTWITSQRSLDPHSAPLRQHVLRLLGMPLIRTSGLRPRGYQRVLANQQRSSTGYVVRVQRKTLARFLKAETG